jgi:tetratricopeptide (TPR) repeat protein
MRWAWLLVLWCGCPAQPFAEAEALERGGDLEGAARQYVRIAKADPANLAAWDRAIELQCRKRIDVGACIGILDLELDLIGSLARHHDALGEVLERRARARLEQGMAEAALEDAERAEKAAAPRAGLYVVKAKAYAGLGRAREARQALEAARRLEPGNEEANAFFADLPPDPEEEFGGGNAALDPPPSRR